MKKYPSIWITEVLTPKGIKWDVSVKLRADMTPKHFRKNTKQEAISFCDEYYGGYNSLIENI